MILMLRLRGLVAPALFATALAAMAQGDRPPYKCVIDDQVSYQADPCPPATGASAVQSPALSPYPPVTKRPGPRKSPEALRAEADARRAAEAKRREEIQKGFRDANSPDTAPARAAAPPTRSIPPAAVVQLPREVAIDRMTTYTTALGRGLACGAPGAKEATNRVAAWMDAQGLQDLTLVAATGINFAFEQQRSGRSPDSCDSVRAGFATMPWP